MSEKKIDLIAQLLAKAESTTPEEAEALTAHAERLMIKYAIDQAVIDERRRLHGQTSEKIIEVSIAWDGMYAQALLDLGSSIVSALGTMRPLQTKRNSRRVLFIVGYESDVQQAEALIRSLHVQSTVSMTSWWNRVREDYSWEEEARKRQARIQYTRSFGLGAAARIRENRLKQVGEASTGTDLVLVGRKDRVDQFIEDNYQVKPARKAPRFAEQDRMAQRAGAEAGLRANTGERAMTQGRGLPAGR